MGKFINPFTDFGFKHIFGREMDKDILIEFLNDLLEGEHTIMDLRIMNNERLPETEQGRKVIFDIHCETDKGERIIIEMQNREQPHFKDRALSISLPNMCLKPKSVKGLINFPIVFIGFSD